MNDDEVWAAIDLQRRRTADLLEQLSDEEWRQPSLCRGWTVRDVAAISRSSRSASAPGWSWR
jgi:hypothetical protein